MENYKKSWACWAMQQFKVLLRTYGELQEEVGGVGWCNSFRPCLGLIRNYKRSWGRWAMQRFKALLGTNGELQEELVGVLGGAAV